MSIATEIARIKQNVADAYTALQQQGALMPAVADSAGLAESILSIGGLPGGYRQLEYIQSDGAAWIDTGVTLDGALSFVMEARLTVANQISSLLVAHNSATVADGRQGFMAFGTASHKIDYFWPGVGYSTLSVDAGIDFLQRFQVIQDRNLVRIAQGGLSSTATYSGTVGTNTATIHLLHSENPNHANYMRGAIYEAQIANGAVLVRDYIPAQREGDGVAGLYDMIGKQFYASAGSGAFIAGPAVG